jgi:hypothetical protein
VIIYEQSPEQQQQVSSEEEAFPPLGSSKSAPSKKSGRGKMASKAHSNKELAASLFRPARPRQNGIENEELALISPVPVTDRAKASSNKYFQQQWDSSVMLRGKTATIHNAGRRMPFSLVQQQQVFSATVGF